jgi:hypothetical protein
MAFAFLGRIVPCTAPHLAIAAARQAGMRMEFTKRDSQRRFPDRSSRYQTLM